MTFVGVVLCLSHSGVSTNIRNLQYHANSGSVWLQKLVCSASMLLTTSFLVRLPLYRHSLLRWTLLARRTISVVQLYNLRDLPNPPMRRKRWSSRTSSTTAPSTSRVRALLQRPFRAWDGQWTRTLLRRKARLLA